MEGLQAEQKNRGITGPGLDLSSHNPCGLRRSVCSKLA
ncbi:hypothetical protein V6Z12_D13G138000 [Gossypium hirsutum]